MRSWYGSHNSIWSSQLLRTEALRAGARLGIGSDIIEDALETVSLVLPSPSTFSAAGRLLPMALRSFDALHLATAVEIGADLQGMVAYDERLIEATRARGIAVYSPR